MSAAVWLPAAVAALVAWQLGGMLTSVPAERAPLQAVAGALALAFAIAAGLAAAPLGPGPWHDARVVLLTAAAVLLAGAWRDVGRGLPYAAGATLVLAAVAVVAFGNVRIGTIKLPFLAGEGAFVGFGAAAPAVTVAFIVVVALVVRATDPLPGLTAGLGAITAATFLIVAVTRGRESLAAVPELTAPLAAAMMGGCLGLLTPGLGPRALALGRGGAGMLGYLLGVLAVIGTLKHTAFLVLGLPVLALAVPLLNVLYMRRQWARAGRSDPVLLDRARTLPEMLLRRGFTHRRGVGLLLGLHAYCCLLALVLVGLITVPMMVKALLLGLLLPAAFAAFFLITRIAATVAVAAPGTVEILGAPIHTVTYDAVMALAEEFIASGRGHHLFTADVSGLMRAREEPELAEIIRTADLVTADGAGVLWAARLFDFPLPERVSGVDLVRRLSGLAAGKGYRVFLLGAAPGVAEEAAEVLRRENPGLLVAGVRDGYFDHEEAVAEELRAAAPQILFVAMGIPRQERFIRRWYQELAIPVCLGVGGSFDVISGRLERAPVWMQRAGLEWLFRVIQEPKRWRRLLALPRFVAAIAAESWRAWRRGRD